MQSITLKIRRTTSAVEDDGSFWVDGWEARRKRALRITGIRRQPFSRISMLQKTHVGPA